MRLRTVVEREGEDLGPVDWSYDFGQHFKTMGCSDEYRDEYRDKRVSVLRDAANRHAAGELIEVYAWDHWRRVYSVCMYDGWPYWKPTPYYHVAGVLGPEWVPFYNVSAVRVCKVD